LHYAFSSKHKTPRYCTTKTKKNLSFVKLLLHTICKENMDRQKGNGGGIENNSMFLNQNKIILYNYTRYRITILCKLNGSFNLQSFCLRFKGLPFLRGSLFSLTSANFHTHISESFSIKSNKKTPSLSGQLDSRFSV